MRGAFYKIVNLLDSNKLKTNISVPLILEYESVALSYLDDFNLTESDIKHFLDYLCRIGTRCKIFYLWRPYLNDSRDDLILELALNSQSDYIISYNKKDFKNVKSLGITVLSPKELLQILGEIK